ncbi:hypothetical protein [Micromonospora sp. NPDC047527]|uniref:hypothetical protein n=1 Tax=Micromonospora sp. NPDC047527 TaxID=3155144 RepID=UPI0033C02487
MSADLDVPTDRAATRAAPAPQQQYGTASEPREAAALAAPAAVARASDRGARIVVVGIAWAWHVAIGLPAVLGVRTEFAAPAVVLGCWGLVAVAGAAAGILLLRGTPLPPWPLAGLLLAADAAVFAAVGEQHLFGAPNWVWSTLGWFFVLMLWGRRVVGLIALLTAHTFIALVAVLAHGPGTADLARFTMYVYGTFSLQVAVFVGGTTIVGLARDRAATATAMHTMAAERAAAERGRRERRDRLALAGAAAGRVLGELADGTADPDDPEVQRRCVLAAARLRRMIAESDDVPDPLLHELRAAADLAERNGLPIDLVTIGSPPPLPVEIRRRLADPLAGHLADAQGWARLTVVSGPDEVVISLVTPDKEGPEATGPPPGEYDHGPVQHLYERDGDIRWAQTRWRK